MRQHIILDVRMERGTHASKQPLPPEQPISSAVYKTRELLRRHPKHPPLERSLSAFCTPQSFPFKSRSIIGAELQHLKGDKVKRDLGFCFQAGSLFRRRKLSSLPVIESWFCRLLPTWLVTSSRGGCVKLRGKLHKRKVQGAGWTLCGRLCAWTL